MKQEIDKLFELIESWQKDNIDLALTIIRHNRALREATRARYLPLLKFVGRKTLRSLHQLPLFLQRPKYHQTGWEPAALQQQVLASIPIEHLHVGGEHYSFLDSWLMYLEQTNFLSISDTHLTALPENIHTLQQLKVCYFSNNHLKKLPESFGQLSSLEQLMIFQYRLPVLPNSLGNLKALKNLSLIATARQYWQLPATLAQCQQLETLTLSHPKMTSIPSWVRSLHQLKRLSCRACHIQVLPEWIGELEHLESINLASNPLQELPHNLKTLPKLKRLNIGMTPLIPSQRKGLLTTKQEVQDFLEHFFK